MKANSMFRWMVVVALFIPVIVTIVLPAPVLAASVILEPEGNGDFTDLQVSGGGTNWFAASAEDDSRYVYTTDTNWALDLYTLPDVALTGTINSVDVWVRARDGISAGQTGVWPSLRTHGFTYPGTAPFILGGTWAYYVSTFPTNPNTGTSWTWDEVNDLQAGVRLRRSAVGVQSDADHVWVVINYGPAAPASVTGVPAFPSIYIGIAAAMGTGILVYFMRRRPVSRKG